MKMLKSWILIQKCFWSLFMGILWLPILFRDASFDVGSSYNGQAVVFLSLGTVSPFFTSRITYEFFKLNTISLILIGFVTYLFFGLVASLFMRKEWGSDFFPVIVENEEDSKIIVVF